MSRYFRINRSYIKNNRTYERWQAKTVIKVIKKEHAFFSENILSFKHILHPVDYDYPSSFLMPASSRFRDSSLPSTSMISVAPAGVICLPERAIRIGHMMKPVL